MNNLSKNKITFGLIFLFLALVLMKNQGTIRGGNPEITELEIIEHIKFMSDDSKKGRYPGTKGSKDVISYIIRLWREIGIKPGGDNGSYVQPFDISDGIEIGNGTKLSIDGKELILDKEFSPMSFSGNGTFSGNAVFAGYGFNINGEINWNDYSELDVSGKWVIVIMDAPEQVHPHSPYFGHASLNKKMMVARDNNALGIIFISKENDGELVNFNHSPASSTGSIPAVQFSLEAANNLFSQLGHSISSIQNKMDSSLKSIQLNLDGIIISTHINLLEKTFRGGNVVGIIEGKDPILKNEFIVLGAHFDHLGMGGHHTGSRKRDTTAVHNGADDNASGTAGIIELSQKLYSKRNQLKRSIIFVAFDAEEKGLLGSKHFVENSSVVSAENITTMINMDMVGRLRDSTISVGAIGTSPDFEPLLDSLFSESDLSFTKSMSGYGPSDHSSFYVNDIPVLFFFTGAHSEYHLPEDDWELINVPGEKTILDFIYNLTLILNQNNERPAFSEAGPKEAPKRSRTNNVTLGIIPSYTGGSSEEGMLIDGVSSKESPAGKAGMIKGDVIIKINGKKLLNIQEYMGRMAELKKGQKIKVTVLRNGDKKVLDVQL